MGIKTFLKKSEAQLQSDERDFVLPCDQRSSVLSWCQKMGIQIESPLDRENRDLCEHHFRVDLWRIRDDDQRALFILRWS
jgi:hypothetical protein